MPKQECLPTNVFGGDSIKQTLFLGLTVVSFSSNLGWNEEPSSIDINLIQDTCAPPEGHSKVYYDPHQTPIEQEWLGADPGFEIFGNNQDEPPRIGSPAFFKFADFEFCGIIHSWTRHDSSEGTDLYTVRLIDPRELLAGCEVIIGDYAGSVGNTYNLFNIYGFQERFRGNFCPSYSTDNDGIIFGSVAQAFGGADLTENGMSWNRIKEGVSLLTSSIPNASTIGAADFSPYGRIVYRGAAPNAKFGLIESDGFNVNFEQWFGVGVLGYLAEYYLDLFDVPLMPTDYRISGSSINLLDLISQICSDANCDFYVDLILVKTGSVIDKFIKVRTVSRATQPQIGFIEAFVDSLDQPIDKSIGRELRNESNTKVLIGGNKQIIWQAEQDTDPSFEPSAVCLGAEELADDIISPFWGIDPVTGDAIPTSLDASDRWEFEAPTAGINATLEILSIGVSTVTINELELKASLGGFDDWASFSETNATDLDGQLDIHGLFRKLTEFLTNNEDVAGRDAVNAQGLAFEKNEARFRDLGKVYEWVHSFASEYYGRKFMVRIPYNCVFQNTDGVVTQILSPVDGGWTEESTVIGISHPSVLTDFFENGDGTLGAFVRFDNSDLNQTKLSQLPQDSYVYNTVTNQLWVKCSVYPDFVYADQSTFCSPRAVIELAFPVDGPDRDTLAFSFKYAGGIVNQHERDGSGQGSAVEDKVQNDIEKEFLKWGEEASYKIPDAVAIPLLNHVNTYGPWFTSNDAGTGPPGQIQVEKDDGLVPWEYGSLSVLNTAAQALANAGISTMQLGELGNISYAGVPNTILGTEIGFTPVFFGSRTRNSTATTLTDSNTDTDVDFVNFYVEMGEWIGTYGPSVTSINVNVADAGITTTYGFRTYTARRGLLNKLFVDRIRKNSLLRRQQQKLLRHIGFANQVALNKKRLGADNTFSFHFNPVHGNNHNQAQKGSPHCVLVAELKKWDKVEGTNDEEWRRTIISDKSIYDIVNNIADDNYEEYALMSWDGLIRPVSMDGSGGLPRYYINSDTPCTASSSRGAIPPLNTPSAVEIYNLDIDIDYLNPFSNPSSLARSAINDRHDGDTGHDIDIVGRGTIADMSGTGHHVSIHTHTTGYNSADRAHYKADYRAMALRGPLLLQSWGYDLDGKPVPNAADTEVNAAAGTFTNENLQDKFLEDFIRKPHTWAVAPVDLRLDRERGLWVTPPAHLLVDLTLTTDINSFGSAVAYLNDGPDLYDADGVSVGFGGMGAAPTVTVKDKVGTALPAGTHVVGYYNPQKCEYWIIESPPSGETSPTCVTNLNCGDIDYTPLTTGMCDLVDRLVGATGIQITLYENLGLISHDIKLNNAGSSTSLCSVDVNQVTANYTRWDTLNLGKNLYAVTGETTCDPYLTVALDVQDTTGCFNPDLQQSTMTATALHFAEGLSVSNDNDDSCGAANISLAMTVLNMAHEVVNTRISRLKEGTNVSFEVESDGEGLCQILKISAQGSGIEIANSGCGGSLDAYTTINQLVASTGIKFFVDSNGIGTIGHDIILSDSATNICDPLATSFNSSEYSKISFGEGLSLFKLTGGDPCEVFVGLALDVASSTGCYVAGDDPSAATLYSILLGDGLGLTTPAAANCGIGTFHLKMTALDDVDMEVGTQFSRLKAGMNVEFEEESNENCHILKISAVSSSGLLFANSGCDTALGAFTIINELVGGNGINGVVDANGVGILNLAIEAQDANSQVVSSDIVKLKQGNNVLFTEETDGNCSVLNIGASGILVANQNCGESEGAFTEVNALVAGPSIDVSYSTAPGNRVSAVLSNGIAISNNTSVSICQGAVTQVNAYKTWDELRISKGLYAFTEDGGDSCIVNISLGIDVLGVGTCYNQSLDPGGAITADGLRFGDGLKINTPLAANCGTPTIHLAMTAYDSADNPVGTSISQLKAASNIIFDTETDGDCSILTIEATDNSGLGIATETCAGTVSSFTDIIKLVMGDGIDVSFNGTTATAKVGLTARNSAGTSIGSNYSQLKSGSNITFTTETDSNCNILTITATDNSGIGVTTVNCGGTVGSYTDIVKMNFGDGIDLSLGGTTATVKVGLTARNSAGTSIGSNYSQLKAGTNVAFTTETDSSCNILTISATDNSGIGIATETCAGSVSSFTDVIKLVMGDGLDVTLNGTTATTKLGFTARNSAGTSIGSNYSQLKAGTNIGFSTETDSNCNILTITSTDNSGLGITTQNCAGTVGSFTDIVKMVVGDGIDLSLASTTATIKVGLTARNSAGTSIGSNYSQLKAGSNVTFSTESDSTCSILTITSTDTSGLGLATQTCAGTTSSFIDIGKLIFGDGIDVSFGSAIATAKIGLTARNSAGTSIGSNYSQFKAGTNITFATETDSNCNILRISASDNSGIAVTTQTCAGTVGSFTDIIRMVFGDGLDLSLASTTATVKLGFTARNNAGSSIGSNYSQLKAGTNVTFTSESDSTCSILTISTTDNSGVQIASSPCGGGTGSFADYTRIIVGGGLILTPMGNTALIKHGIQINETTNSACGGTSFSGTTYDTIDIGRGLLAVQNGSCGVRIGIGISILDTSTCYGQGIARVNATADSISLGDGLKLTAASSCGDVTFHLAFTARNNAGTAIGTNFSQLKAGSGVTFVAESDSSCSVLRIDAGGLSVANQNCGSSVESYSSITNLIFGIGLDFTDLGGGIGIVNHGINLSNSSTSVCSADSFFGTNYSNIDFGKGIRVTEGSSCQARVGLAMDVGSISNVDHLVQGCNIRFDAESDCGAEINSYVTVNGTNVGIINFNSPLIVSTNSAGCGSATVGLNLGGGTANVNVLTDVQCESDGTLTGEYTRLTFVNGVFISATVL